MASHSNASNRMLFAVSWINPGVNDLATNRQPERPAVVTHVLGTFRYLCLRAGHIDFIGERGGTRTLDPMIKSHVLYRLSYALTSRLNMPIRIDGFHPRRKRRRGFSGPMLRRRCVGGAPAAVNSASRLINATRRPGFQRLHRPLGLFLRVLDARCGVRQAFRWHGEKGPPFGDGPV